MEVLLVAAMTVVIAITVLVLLPMAKALEQGTRLAGRDRISPSSLIKWGEDLRGVQVINTIP